MAEIQLGAVEARFADIIWEREPVTSSELIKLAAAKLTWKRTTTHTVLRRLCDKGLFQNNNGMATSLLSRPMPVIAKSMWMRPLRAISPLSLPRLPAKRS